MSTFAVVAVLGMLTGYALGWLGRFAFFALALSAIVLCAVLVLVLGSRPAGEVVLFSLTVLFSLQIGYGLRILQGAAAIARRRRTRLAEGPSADGASAGEPAPARPPAVERYR